MKLYCHRLPLYQAMPYLGVHPRPKVNFEELESRQLQES